ncbi:unnamed protein product [Dovyalis caffra]|uniref:Glycine-rich protein n=1 Tax=Dovyalis caffra TaxID=77055 RepID=A0AAV1SLW2_9ROSI|nr:unnamed protein product [Dovyalis caffra]
MGFRSLILFNSQLWVLGWLYISDMVIGREWRGIVVGDGYYGKNYSGRNGYFGKGCSYADDCSNEGYSSRDSYCDEVVDMATVVRVGSIRSLLEVVKYKYGVEKEKIEEELWL